MSKCSLCGDIILADTEDWVSPLCYNCWQNTGSLEQDPQKENVIFEGVDKASFDKLLEKSALQSKIIEDLMGALEWADKYSHNMVSITTDRKCMFCETLASAQAKLKLIRGDT